MHYSKLKILLLFIIFIAYSAHCQNILSADTTLLYQILSESPDKFGKILSNLNHYRIQIIYTQINKTNDKISLEHHTLRYRPEEYFYPASIVKLPLSLIALEKINKLKSEGVTRDTRIAIDSAFTCQTSVKYDYTAADSFPSIGNYIKKALVVSDNDAYCRLYEFVGQSYVNFRLNALGYPAARIIHRFNYCDSTQNKYTNSVTFYNKFGNVIWYQEPKFNSTIYSKPMENMKIGEKQMVGNNIILHAKNFAHKNCMPLGYIHDMLIKIFYPQFYNPWEQFNINEDDMKFLKKQLSSIPSETGIPEYSDKKKYWDACTNYLFYGYSPSAVINTNLKIYNIVGLSYGFSIDCAYFSDTTNNIRFFLSAVIYTNANSILNDSKYEYSSIAMPFLKELGKTIYEYEILRAKTGN